MENELEISGAEDLIKDTQCLLQVTKLISPEDLKDPFWSYLDKQYKTVKTPSERALVSIMNSIFFQNRHSFAITRSFLARLVHNDFNHKKAHRTFDNNNYSKILAMCYRLKIMAKLNFSSKILTFNTGEAVAKLRKSAEIPPLSAQELDAQYQQTKDFSCNNETSFVSPGYQAKTDAQPKH